MARMAAIAGLTATLALANAAGAAPHAPPQPPHLVSVQPVQPDAATLAAAMHYLDAVQFEENSMRTVDLMVDASFASLVDGFRKQYGDALPNDLLEKLHTAIHDHAVRTMRADMADMKRQTAMVYASEFTRQELIHLTELQSDPVAVKARARAKEMQPKLMMIGINAMRASQPQLDAEIKQIVTDYFAAHGDSPQKGSAS